MFFTCLLGPQLCAGRWDKGLGSRTVTQLTDHDVNILCDVQFVLKFPSPGHPLCSPNMWQIMWHFLAFTSALLKLFWHQTSPCRFSKIVIWCVDTKVMPMFVSFPSYCPTLHWKTTLTATGLQYRRCYMSCHDCFLAWKILLSSGWIWK